MKPKKLSKEEKKELQDQFPKIAETVESEEKASWVGIAVMIFWIAMLVGVLYYLYLTLTYQTI